MKNRPFGKLTSFVVAFCFAGLTIRAQDPAPPPGAGTGVPILGSADLQQLLQPVALYPDPLLSELLPAATVPTQIVMASRFVSENSDPSQIDNQPWDPSVKAIAHYPQLLKWMDDNLPWTTQVGQAFSSQEQDVMDAVQALRAKAQSLGNLPSTPQETVQDDNGEIDIEPTQPDQIYIPAYQPDAIYEDPGVYCTFGVGFPIGFWLWNDWDWHHHRIISWGPGHARPDGWWHWSPSQRIGEIGRYHPGVWHPGVHAVGRAYGLPDRGWAGISARGSTMHIQPVGRPVAVSPVTRAPEFARPAERPVERPIERPVERAPEVRPQFERPEVRENGGVGIFGGPQNSFEARQSSARGMESRSFAAPAAPARSAPSFSNGGGGGGGGGRRR